MGYTMEQRLRKEQLLLAYRAIVALTASTVKAEMRQNEVIPWIMELLSEYAHNLAEARKVGKINGVEYDLLYDDNDIPRLCTAWSGFVSCLLQTKPLMDRLANIDSMTNGKGLVVLIPGNADTGDPVTNPSLNLVCPTEDI